MTHETKPTYDVAVERSGILKKLALFQATIAGTAPLGLSIEDSDIDVLCYANCLESLEQSIWAQFRDEEGFSLRRWLSQDRPVIAVFMAHGWPFQIFGTQTPVREQVGWSLFQTELRLIKLGGERLKFDISALRTGGMKTIPAIARLLQLEGDPFQALLPLSRKSDPELTALIVKSQSPDDR